jgi:hypothetical protein
MKSPLKPRLPSAPADPLDRIARGADQWTRQLHGCSPAFAAAAGIISSRWDDASRRRIADQAVRDAFAGGRINPTELATWLAILRTWEAQTPGARMAALVAFTELHGRRYSDPQRVLTMPLAW